MKFANSTPASIREIAGSDLMSCRSTPRRMVARLPVQHSIQYKLEMTQESEDAKLTGATRSLARRLLALNLRGTVNRQTLSAL